MIADSNLLILAAKLQHPELRLWVDSASLAISAISKVEMLGYQKLEPVEKHLLELFHSKLTSYPITDVIIDRAIALRQAKRMSLGDSLIAATALVHGQVLATHNTRDFKNIPDLIVVDPLDPTPPPSATLAPTGE